MSSFTLFETTCIVLFIQIPAIFSKQITLKPSTIASATDLSVHLGPGATVIADLWHIDVTSQQSTDLHIQLGSSWGFHPNVLSTIELFIRGNTSDETLLDDGEIFFLFSAADTYFAEQISIDNVPVAYKECPHTNTPLISRNLTEMIHSPLPDRYYRFCNNSVHTQSNIGSNHWRNTGGSAYKTTAKWPLFIKIENDPISNTVDYQYGDNADPPGPKLSSQYTSSFPTNQGVDIHIAGENLGEDFNIFSISITYTHKTTKAPTIDPTMAPISTSTPTNTPTTRIPTTIQPTLSPVTMQPTTVAPTTVYPTTINPTIMPTIYPTTMSPTTMSPTTIQPTSAAPTTTYPSHMPITTSSTSTTIITEPPLDLEITAAEIKSTEVVIVTDIERTQVTKNSSELVTASNWNDSLLIIIGVVLLSLVCVCCVILFMACKLKRMNDAKSNRSVKNYNGVHAMHRQSTSLQTNQLHPYNRTNVVSNMRIQKKLSVDGDITTSYNGYNYKSSESRYHEPFDMNSKQKVFSNSVDFSRNMSSAVTSDDIIILDDVDHHLQTNSNSDDEVIHHMRDNTESYIDMNMNTDRRRGKTFNNNLVNAAAGNDIMMGDVINEMETNKGTGDFNTSDSDDEEYQKSKYEIGMVNISKISEMAPQSGGSQPYIEMETIGGIDDHYNKHNRSAANINMGNYNINNDNVMMEGNQQNDDYENNDEYGNEESDPYLEEMETAGFIDGDYNELEYEDEYYEDEFEED